MNETEALEAALKRAAEELPAGPLPELDRAASDAGLVDVAYATLDSPVGTLLLAATDIGLVRLAYIDHDEDDDTVLADLAARVSPRVLASARKLDEPRRELEQYFEGRRQLFEVPLDWQLIHGFARRVLGATARIPFGSVLSYKQVASEAGSPRASRAAGNALGSNPLPIVIPCHRVVHAGGGLGGYTGGLQRKRALLEVESRA